MKIAIASLGDPRLVKTWSGIPSHIVSALEARGHEVVGIALETPAEPWHYNWQRRLYWHLQKKWLLTAVEKDVLQAIGQQFDQEVAAIDPAVVLVIHGDFLAYSSFKQPAVIINDATFASVLDYYNCFSNLTARSVAAGNEMYQRALSKTSAAVYSADWASQSAVRDYGTPAAKVHTIPFGANLTNPPAATTVIAWVAKRAQAPVCKLLFLGVDWPRKGGPDALRFVAHLNSLGIASQLTVVGCSPEIPAQFQDQVAVMGFLSKSIPAEAARLEAVLEEASVLLLPSLAECFGCVYCEANAYGLPALGRDTGGIPEIIREGVNGLLLGTDETPEAFAERWAAIWCDKAEYTELALTARQEFDERLNYQAFASELEHVLTDVVVHD